MRLDPDLKAKLQKLAENDGRSLTNYLERKLLEIAERDGEVPRDARSIARTHARGRQ